MAGAVRRLLALHAARICRTSVTLLGALPSMALAQSSAMGGTPLVFDKVAVVDVEQGKIVPGQRVVIVGNRIRGVGSASAVPLPSGARVVDATGKYLIPGLWDMHTHLSYMLPNVSPKDFLKVPLAYELFLTRGGTGFRDVGSALPLDSLKRWRQEILAGTRVGPPRQLLSGGFISSTKYCSSLTHCVTDSAGARRLVDSLKAAGVDMLKFYDLSPEMYFTLAAEARRVGLPFGGHLGFLPMYGGRLVSPAAASDSGASIVDHMLWGVDSLCYEPDMGATVDRCRPLAERFRQNGTWSLPNVIWHANGEAPKNGRGKEEAYPIIGAIRDFSQNLWNGLPTTPDWLREAAHSPSDTAKYDLQIAERAGLPILTGTDIGIGLVYGTEVPFGVSLDGELALLVSWGMTPLGALQAATLNPAKMLHATDSLGTVAEGKLADLVLLDDDPLVDITNVTMVRAVVANGRYFDRAALDALQRHVLLESPAP